jgi:hypothetical protein
MNIAGQYWTTPEIPKKNDGVCQIFIFQKAIKITEHQDECFTVPFHAAK